MQEVEISGDSVNISLTSIYDVKDIFELSLEELMQVEVTTASKSKQSSLIAPATIYVVTEQEIIENGYVELIDVIENIPGMGLVHSDFFSDGGQRGVTGDFSKTLILMNGREMQNLIAAEAFITHQFATHNVKQIEIIQGPASALYGANALVGIINIITKNNSPDFSGIEYKLELGTQNTQAHSIVFGTKNEKFRISGSFRYFDTDSWDFSDFVNDSINFSEGFSNVSRVKNIKYKNQSFAMPLSLKVEYENFYIGLEKYRIRSGKGLENVAMDYISQFDYRDFNMYYAGYKHDFNEQISANLEIQYYNEKFWGQQYQFNASVFEKMVAEGRNNNEPLTIEEINDNFMSVYSQQNSSGSKRYQANVQLNYNGNYFSLIGGYTFNLYDLLGMAISTDQTNPLFDETRSDNNRMRLPFYRQTKNSMFLQFQKPFFNEKLFLTLGGRFDYQEFYKEILTFRSGLVYKPFEKTYFKLLFGQAFREPTIFEQVAFSINPNQNIKPIKINTYELSFNQTITSNIVFNCVFYKSLITDNIIPSGIQYDYKNTDIDKNIFGLESQIFVKFGAFKSDFSYAYVNTGKETYANQEILSLDMWKHRGIFGITYQILSKFTINSRINYYSEVEARHGNSEIEKLIIIPSYTKVDATLTHFAKIKNTKINISLIITNVFDGKFYQPNVRISGPKQYLQPGRQFVGQLIFKI